MAGLDFPIICPTLVGRDQALAGIEAFVASRPPGVNTLLVSGEAGIGKSRLLQAATEQLRDRGVQVLGMACYEEDAGLPYAGAKDLLRGLLRRDEAFIDAHVRPNLGALSPLLPDHRRDGEGTGDQRVAIERDQMDGAVLAVVESVASAGPCVLVVEDLHWCDGNTLTSLLHVARNTREQPVTLLLTLRQEDTSPDLRGFLAALDRERLASELRLQRLTLSETDEMLKAIFRTSRSTRIEMLHGLYRLTEGNPFFVEEVLRSLLADAPGGDLSSLRFDQVRVPRTVQEAVGRRVDALTPDAGRLVELASVVGARFDVETLSEISGRDAAGVIESLRELVQGQLVVESGSGDFAFRHALTREAVGSRLLSRERALLHSRIADHIEASLSAVERAADLSYHYSEAGHWEKTLVYAERAAHDALAMHAPSIALEHYERAMRAASQLRREAGSGVHRGMASALEELGDFARAQEHLEHAIAIAERAGDRAGLVDCLLDLGLLSSSRDYAATMATYERAVAVARELGDAGRLARALSRLGNGHSNTGNFDAALPLLDEALAAFRALDDERGVADTLDLIGMTGLMSGRFPESLGAYREAIGLLERFDEKRHRISSLASIPVLSGTYQSSVLAPALSLREARPYVEEALTLARELGVPSDLAYALWQYGFWAGPQGMYREAFAAAQESLDTALEVGHTQWEAAARVVLGALYCDVLRLPEAEAQLRRGLALSDEMGSSLWTAQMQNLLTDVLIAARRPAEATAMLEGIQPAPPGSMYDVWRLAAVAEAACALGDNAASKRTIEAIGQTRPIGLKLRRLLGLIAAREGDPAAGASTLAAAAADTREQGNRSLEWRLHCDLAHLHLDAGDREAAREAAVAALGIIDELAVSVEAPEAFRVAAASLLPASLRQRPARDARTPLTPREAEIAAAIAQGMTNRQIADALVVSSRTVETHVANAMAKLGFSTRSQLAAWSIEHAPPGAARE